MMKNEETPKQSSYNTYYTLQIRHELVNLLLLAPAKPSLFAALRWAAWFWFVECFLIFADLIQKAVGKE